MANVTPLPAGTLGSIVIAAGPFLNVGTITNAGGTITAATMAATGLLGGSVGAVPGIITLGTGLTLTGTVLHT